MLAHKRTTEISRKEKRKNEKIKIDLPPMLNHAWKSSTDISGLKI